MCSHVILSAAVHVCYGRMLISYEGSFCSFPFSRLFQNRDAFLSLSCSWLSFFFFFFPECFFSLLFLFVCFLFPQNEVSTQLLAGELRPRAVHLGPWLE